MGNKVVKAVLLAEVALLVEAALLAAAVLLTVAVSQVTGLVLYSIIGDGKGGFIGITALLILEGDGKCDIIFLSEIVFFLGRAVAKHIVYLSIFFGIY